MRILVAVHTERKLYLEQCTFARWPMALVTLDRGVFPVQREAGSVVIGDSKRSLFEALNRVARFAAAAVCTVRELSMMRIGLMAVGAKAVRNRRLEVSAAMARLALHLHMLTQQGKPGFGMVEVRHEGRLLPASSAMAGFAGLLERTMMWIRMAG